MTSTQQWKEWIEGVVDQRRDVFSRDPDEMVSAYNREVGYTRDYHGRELFELLQNADDASVKGERTQRGIVILRKEGLCFANTGRPFSKAGIKSLMISDNSPKKRSKAQYIGNRGLGFRSVLSWTDCPFIVSSNLLVGFDRERAVRWLEDLAQRNADVRKKVEEVAQDASVLPIPTLAIPAVLDEQGPDPHPKPGTPNFETLWSLAQELRTEGYDTVIALPFTKPDALSEAKAQLAQMGREVLLFLHNVQELAIESPGRSTVWIAHGSDSHVEISSDESEEPTQKWEIHTRTGSIPGAMLREDQRDAPDYEMRLAIPPEDVDVPETLFNYFPTKVRFPFPLVAHVTLELTNNRQNLAESKANAYLLAELAGFMAETAQSIATTGGDDSDPWRPLSLITPRGDLDKDVLDLGFREALMEEARTRDLIPVRDGRKLATEKARTLAVRHADWLPDHGFEDVVLDSGDRWLVEMVENLGTSRLTEDELRDRLNRAPHTLPIPERAALIGGLIRTGVLPKNPTPDLLVDSVGKPITADIAPFLPPGRGDAFELPKWVDVRLLHAGLIAALRSEFGDATATQLVGHLSAFEVQEYSLREVARNVNRTTNKEAAARPDLETDYRLAGLSALFNLYKQSSTSDDRDVTRRQTDLRVKVPNREGRFVEAGTLYLGEEYPGGELTEVFYSSLSPEKMVASPDLLALKGNVHQVGEFLSWLGVAAQPRLVKLQMLHDKEFHEYVRGQLSYPATFEDGIIVGSSDALPTFDIRNVSWVDGLDKVLGRPDPHAIVAWLASDGRLRSWLREKDDGVRLSFRPQGKRSPRRLQGQLLPSYVTWLLRRKEWLPVPNGSLRAPGNCTLAANLPEKAKAMLPRPDLHESDGPFRRLGIDQKAIHAALALAGVPIFLDDMSWDDFYDLLLRLPELDPGGEHARAMYRVLVARTDDGDAFNSPVRKKFEQEGKLWARRNGFAGYCSVSDGIYYEDDATIPEIVVRRMSILHLDRRRGAQKVKRLFNVEPLSSVPIIVDIQDADVDKHPRWRDLNAEVERLKPYAYAMRLHSDTNAEGLSRLRNLDVILCRSATGLVLVGDDEREIPISLSEGEKISVSKGVQLREGEKVYLCANTEASSEGSRLLTDDIAYDVGDVLARLLGVENVGDFVALAECSPDRRNARLRKMLGTDPKELLEEARHKLKVGPEANRVDRGGKGGYVPPTERKPEGGTSVAGTDGPVNGEEGDEPSKEQGPVGRVGVDQGEHHPDPGRGKVKKRVSVTASSGKPRVGSYQVTDYVRCEQLAARFEEAEGQNRFPLPVAHLTGSDYYGCDLLSFDTEEDRELFRSQGEDPDLSLVARFIEVKGRKSEKGSITLEGNELEAAQEYLDRFYLYRVFEKDGEFELAILNDPLAASPPVKYEVNLFQSARMKKFRVQELDD